MPGLGSSPDGTVTVFDIGGTHMRRGRWSPRDGDKVREYVKTASPSRLRHPTTPVPRLRERLVTELCEAVPDEPQAVAALSLGAALHADTGMVYASAPLWGDWDEPFDLHTALAARRPDVRWHIVNDVTAALLHYATDAACRDRRKVMLVTVSSGIACRTVDRAHDVIPVDGCGLQGEIGHLPSRAVLAGRPVELDCDCGAPAHLASFASGPGIRRTAAVMRERLPRQWSRSLLADALDGDSFESRLHDAVTARDPIAVRLLDTVTRPLAELLATALSLDPAIDGIGLTGGVAQGLGEYYRKSIVEQMLQIGPYLTRQRTPGWIADRVAVCGAGQANGLIGAGIAALAATTGAAVELSCLSRHGPIAPWCGAATTSPSKPSPPRNRRRGSC